jgi:NAD dependent epimerase/dehydratase family
MTMHAHQTAPTRFVPTAKPTALVTGASGLAGGYMLAQLLEQGGWDVVAVSRRKPRIPGDYKHIAVDLLDLADCRTKLGPLATISHLFYLAKPPFNTRGATYRAICRLSASRPSPASARVNSVACFGSKPGSRQRRRSRISVLKLRDFCWSKAVCRSRRSHSIPALATEKGCGVPSYAHTVKPRCLFAMRRTCSRRSDPSARTAREVCYPFGKTSAHES